MKTLGISPKAFLAAVFPALSTLVGVLVNGAFSGFDETELKGAVVGLVLAALAFIGAYLGNPGVVVGPDANGPASDDELVGVRGKLGSESRP